MADRMKVEGGRVTVEGGAVTSVDFVATELILEPGVVLRNCTVDVDTVMSTAGLPAHAERDAAEPMPVPPVPPMPVLADAEL